MQILIKSLIFRTLQIYIFSFYAFLFFVSLAYAKVIKILHKMLLVKHFLAFTRLFFLEMSRNDTPEMKNDAQECRNDLQKHRMTPRMTPKKE